jgi:hypothetical protein
MRVNTSRLGSLLRPASRGVTPSLSENEIGSSKMSSRASPAISASRLSPIPSTHSSLIPPESQPLGHTADTNNSSRSPLNLSKSALHDRLFAEQALQGGSSSTHSASNLFSAQQVHLFSYFTVKKS